MKINFQAATKSQCDNSRTSDLEPRTSNAKTQDAGRRTPDEKTLHNERISPGRPASTRVVAYLTAFIKRQCDYLSLTRRTPNIDLQ